MVRKADQNEAPHAQETQGLTVDGCVCPQCFNHLRGPVVTDAGTDRYGRRMRSYTGMCFPCSKVCRVEQFEADGKWLLHSFLHHRYEKGRFIGYGEWIEVNPLPEPPAVLNGPGGDFVNVPNPDYDPSISAIQGAAALLLQASNAIGELLKAIEKLRHNEPNKRKH